MPSTRHDVTGLLARVYTLISQSNCQAYVVGGFVRDQQSGRDTADIDIAVSNAAPRLAREIADAFSGKYVLLNEANNIARVVLQDSQNIRYLDFSQISDNIETDLARRDFTINAMAIELGASVSGSFNIIDPFQGQADLDSRPDLFVRLVIRLFKRIVSGYSELSGCPRKWGLKSKPKLKS